MTNLARKPTRELTQKAEDFAYAVGMLGLTKSKAYRTCYDVADDTTPGSVWSEAYKLSKDLQVTFRIRYYQRLREAQNLKADDIQLMVKAFLIEVLEDETEATTSRLASSKQLGEATRLFTQQVETVSKNLNINTNMVAGFNALDLDEDTRNKITAALNAKIAAKESEGTDADRPND